MNPQLLDKAEPDTFPDPTVAPSFNKLLFNGFKWSGSNEERMQTVVQSAKDEYAIPFDEIYHKEKKIID